MSDEVNMRLFRAAARGSLSHALLAIEAGANIHARDYNNQTAVCIARSRNYLELVDELVNLGAEKIHAKPKAQTKKTDSKKSENPTIKRRPISNCDSEPLNKIAENVLRYNFPAIVLSRIIQ